MIGNNGINQGQNIIQYQFITNNDKSCTDPEFTVQGEEYKT